MMRKVMKKGRGKAREKLGVVVRLPPVDTEVASSLPTGQS